MGKYNVKVIEYDSEIQVNFYSYSISKEEDGDKAKYDIESDKQFTESGKQSSKDDKQDINDSNKEIENIKRSIRRSKQSIYELARANNWEWFATFTFKDNRYDYDICKDRLRQWFNNFKKRKVDDFEYLCVPERHEDGAYHFHALLKGQIAPYIDFKGWNKEKYVFTCYSLGISEIEPVRDTNRVSSYITKYITKDLLDGVKGSRRYFYSKGCKKPSVKEYFTECESIYEFIEGNFVEMPTYAKTVEYGQNTITYLQMKKNQKTAKKTH